MDGYQKLVVCFSSGSSSIHSMYCKRHAVRQNSDATPNDRTLFSLGWPPYCNRESIEELFSRVGHVINVYLQGSPGSVEKFSDGTLCDDGFKVCYVVFSTDEDVTAALRLCLTSDPISCHIPISGVQKWAREYVFKRPSVVALEMEAQVGVALYDQQQKEAERLRNKKGQADEDGWITITRKTPKLIGQEQSKRQRKRKRATAMNVYPWQLRESQREQVAEMRCKYEKDKERVALLKARRKFKPF